jgi:hypothetical protein
VSEELDIRFSGDDGDVPADVLGIGYPRSAIELAEAAEELSALERAPGEAALDDERPTRRLDQPVRALGLAALVGVLVGVAMTRAA